MKYAVLKITLAVFLGFAAGSLVLVATAEEVCYEPYGQEVTGTHLVTNLVISVRWIDPEGSEDEAWSECEIQEDFNIGWCDIWVPMPVKVLGDPYMDALGHEVLHGLIGDFHESD